METTMENIPEKKQKSKHRGYSAILEGIASSYDRITEAIASKSGLTFSQYRILVFLFEQKHANPKEIAKRLGLKRNTVSVAAAGLLRIGLVDRDITFADKRIAMLCRNNTTEKTIQTVEKALDQLTGIVLTPSALELVGSYITSETDLNDLLLDTGLLFNSLHLSIVNALYKLHSSLIRTVGGISLTQYRLLLKADSDNRLCLADLALELRLKPTSISEALLILQGLNLVVRVTNPRDSRYAWIEITPEGLARLTKVNAELKEIWSEVFTPFAWLQISHVINNYLTQNN
jgi:DNA-binding MarR family transcriptional regulator